MSVHDGGNAIPSIAREEHANDNVVAKRVVNYVWNSATAEWERQSSSISVSTVSVGNIVNVLGTVTSQVSIGTVSVGNKVDTLGTVTLGTNPTLAGGTVSVGNVPQVTAIGSVNSTIVNQPTVSVGNLVNVLGTVSANLAGATVSIGNNNSTISIGNASAIGGGNQYVEGATTPTVSVPSTLWKGPNNVLRVPRLDANDYIITAPGTVSLGQTAVVIGSVAASIQGLPIGVIASVTGITSNVNVIGTVTPSAVVQGVVGTVSASQLGSPWGVLGTISFGRAEPVIGSVAATIQGTPNVAVTSFPDNEPFNVAQINGVTVAMNTGNSSTGTQRVVLATDQPAVNVIGTASAQGHVAQDSPVAGNPVLTGGRASAAEPSAMSGDADSVYNWLDRKGRQIVAMQAGTNTLTGVSAATSSVVLLASNTSRKGASIYNDSNNPMYMRVGLGAASATVFTAKMQPYDYFEVPFGGTGTISGIWATGLSGSAQVNEYS